MFIFFNLKDNITQIKIGIIIVGIIFAVISAKHAILASKSSDTPQTITCQQLIDNGPGDNCYIQLKDFVICSNYFVYETTSYGNENGPYKVIYMPMVPAGSPWHLKVIDLYQKYGEKAKFPPPTNIKMILKMSDVKDKIFLEDILNVTELKGMVVNAIASIGSEEEKLLQQGYPGIDVDECLIFEPNRQPPSLAHEASMLTGSVLVLGVGVLWLVWPKLAKRKARLATAAANPGLNVDDFAPPAPEVEPNKSEPTTETLSKPDMPLEDDKNNPYA